MNDYVMSHAWVMSLLGFAGGLIGQLAPAYAAWISSGALPPKLKGLMYWTVTLLVAATAGVLAPLLVSTGTQWLHVPPTIFAFGLGVTAPQLLIAISQQGTRKAERQAREKLEEAEKAIEREPEKARPYWEASSARLELYFQRNLSQTKSIFWITVGVLLAGFVLICYGVAHAFKGADIKAAQLTAASGVVTEFIAATFLVIYRSTTSQASEFVTALERINAVGMALQIVDSITEGAVELRNKTRAELALKLLGVFGKESTKKEPRATSTKKKDTTKETDD